MKAIHSILKYPKIKDIDKSTEDDCWLPTELWLRIINDLDEYEKIPLILVNKYFNNIVIDNIDMCIIKRSRGSYGISFRGIINGLWHFTTTNKTKHKKLISKDPIIYRNGKNHTIYITHQHCITIIKTKIVANLESIIYKKYTGKKLCKCKLSYCKCMQCHIKEKTEQIDVDVYSTYICDDFTLFFTEKMIVVGIYNGNVRYIMQHLPINTI